MRSSIVMVGLALAVGGLSGCGRIDPDTKPRGTRVPRTLQFSVAITPAGTTASVPKVGAGPARITVSNQSQSRRRLVLLRGGRVAGETDVMAPSEVGAIKATLRQGTYKLRAGSKARTTVLRVREKRNNADAELLLP